MQDGQFPHIEQPLVNEQGTVPGAIDPFEYSKQRLEQYTQKGTTMDALWKDVLGTAPAKGENPEFYHMRDIDNSGRYNMYDPHLDVEELHAQSQSGWDKLGNGIVKMFGNAAATTLQGTIGAVYGLGKFMQTGDFSDVYDNDFNRNLDKWNKGLENKFPHFYTHQEQDADWYSPQNWFTGNFFWDKIIKNMGFALGAAATGWGYAQVLRGIGLTGYLVKQGKAMELLSSLEPRLAAVPQAQRFNTFTEVAKDLAMKYGVKPAGQLLQRSDRILSAAFATTGEAAIEALHNTNEFRQHAIDEYTRSYGFAPTGEALAEINAQADNVGNWSYGLNTALLTMTNYAQWPRILGSSYKAEKAVVNSIETQPLTRTATGAFKSALPEKGIGKGLYKVKSAAGIFFNPIEGFEEGAQYAVQRGTDNYFNKRLSGKETDWLSDGLGYGVSKVIGTKEGMENVLIGAVSGGIMTSGILKKVGIGQGGVIQERGVFGYGGKRAAATQEAIAALNKSSFPKYMKDYTDASQRAEVSQRDRQKHVRQGDILEAKEDEFDFTHDYLMPRVKYGRYDVVKDDIAEARAMAATQEGMQALKEDGKAATDDTQASFLARLDNVERHADNVYSLYKSLNLKYGGAVRKKEDGTIDRVYPDEVIDKMVYAASKVTDYDTRIQQLSTEILLGAPEVDLQGVIDRSYAEEDPKKATEETLKAINALDILSTEKDDLKRALQDVVQLSHRRKTFMKEYNSMVEEPGEWKNKYQGLVDESELGSPVQIKRGTELEVGKEYGLKEPFFREKNRIAVSPYLQIISKTLGGEVEVRLPDGRETFVKPSKLKNYALSGDRTTNPKYEELVNTAIGKVLERGRWKALDDPKTLQGRVDLVNRMDNARLSNEVEAQVIADTKEWLERQKKIDEEKAKLEKYKKIFFKQNEDISKSSGKFPTGSTEVDKEPEPQKKATSILFTSSTGPSADLKDVHKRELSFLNNAKNHPNKKRFKVIMFTAAQEQALGLGGFVASVTKGTEFEAKQTDVDEAPVLLAHIEDAFEGQFFIDKDGKRIGEVGEVVDQNRVIVSFMPTTSLTWRNGEARYRSGERDAAEAQAQGWRTLREALLKAPATEYKAYDYVISRGQPIFVETIDGKKERVPVTDGLIPESELDRDGLIVIPDNGVISHNGEAITFPNGRPVLQYEDTLVFLNNRRFTDQEAKLLSKLVYRLSLDPEKLNRQIVTYLQNVLYWGKAEDQTTNGRNQIYIDSETGDLVLGNNEVRIPFTPLSLEENKEALEAFFKLAYNSVNNFTLTKKKKDPFEQIYGINDDGTLKVRKWKSYQRYLLSPTVEEGERRNTEFLPLFTHIRPINKDVENDYNFEQKYVTLQGLEIPTKKKKTAAEEIPYEDLPKAKPGVYTPDGKTMNVYLTKSGESVSFSYTDPSELTIVQDAEYKKTIERVSKLTTALDSLRAQGATGTDEQVADILLRTAIMNDIQSKATVVPPSTPAQEPKSLKETGKGKREFSLVTSLNVSRMTEQDYEAFKVWHEENVPGIPFKRLEHMIVVHPTLQAWGVFEDGVAQFYRHAARGTEYHEIFEGVWAGFLSDEEKTAVIEEYRAKPKNASLTDKQVKEKIADEFAQYRLNKIDPRSLGQKIRDFFQSILRFFKYFISGRNLKHDLFEKINVGAYRGEVLPEGIENLRPQYSVAGLSEEDTHLAVQDIAARVFSYVFGDDNSSLWDMPSVTVDEIFNNVRGEWVDEKKMDIVGEDGWLQLVSKTKDFLKTFNIEFDEDNVVTINDEGRNKNDYSPEAFTVDAKKSSPYPIKILTSILPKTDPKEGKVTLSGVEFTRLKESPIKGKELINSNRAFITVMEKVTDSTSLDEMMEKLSTLAKDNPDYERLASRLKVNYTTGEVNYKNLSDDDWRTLIAFGSVFGRHRYAPYTQYINMGQVYVGSGSLATIARQTIAGWIENMKGLSEDPKSFVKYDGSSRAYVVHPDIEMAPIRTAEDRERFLAAIGIEFPKEVFNKLKPFDKTKAIDATAAIKSHISKAQQIATLNGKTLGINGPLNTLAELSVKVSSPNQDSTFFNAEREPRQLFENPNYVSTFEDIFNSSSTLEELLDRLPHLKDDFSDHSLILKEDGLFFDSSGKRIKDIRIGYADGTVYTDEDYGTSTKRMLPPDRMVMEFNHNLDGKQYILLPADGSTEWLMDMGVQVSYSEFQNSPGNVWQKIYSIFTGYLMDELYVASTPDMRKEIMSVSIRATELRFFKDILSADLNEKVKEFLESDTSTSTFIEDNKDAINAAVKAFIQETVRETKQALLDNGQLFVREDGTYDFPFLQNTFTNSPGVDLNKQSLSEEDVNRLIHFRNINSMINTVELHKLLYGDPYQFDIKGKALDETRRIKLSLSPIRRLHTSDEFNNFANSSYNKAGKLTVPAGIPGHHTFKDYARTSTISILSDNELVVGSTYFMEDLPDEVKEAYAETKESDSFSFMLADAYREVKIRGGQWDNKDAELFYQWDAAVQRRAFLQKGLITVEQYPSALQEQDSKLLATGRPTFHIEVMKPRVFGVKYGSTFINLVGDKLAQMPLFYSLLPEGSNIQNLYIKMWKEGRDYVIFHSGRKVGAEGVHDLYTQEGRVNAEPFNNEVKVGWDTWAFQLENAYDESKKSNTLGSQTRKVVTVDLMDGGIPVDAPEGWEEMTEEQKEKASSIYKKVKWHQKLDEELIEDGYNTFLKKLGITDTGDGFIMPDAEKAARTLQNEIKRRALSDNALSSITIDPATKTFKIAPEASPKYKQIRDILYSIVDKSIIRPKVNGGMKVQIPSVLWENQGEGRGLAYKKDGKWTKISRKDAEALTPAQKKTIRLTSSRLHWYTKKEPWIEVLLPHWFGEKMRKTGKTDEEILQYLNTAEGREILSGIGFRIPTQHLSSIEVFRVKGFLPQEFGDTIVVPSEITVKAGSDFDIDKLNTYLKNTYVDGAGRVRLIKFYNIDTNDVEQMKDFYEENLLERFKKFKAKEEIYSRTEEELLMLDAIFGEAVAEDEFNELKKQYIPSLDEFLLTEKGQDIFALNREWGQYSYRKALENAYFSSMQDILTLPQNFERLLTPTTEGGLKDIADSIMKLRGEEERDASVSQLLNPNYITKLRNDFLVSKKWIAIVALNITNHSLAQRQKTYVDVSRATPQDRIWLGDGAITLKHNTVKVGDKEYPSLSSIKNVKGKYISDVLSSFGTATVDAPKDPFILRVVPSDVAINTALYMVRIGIDEEKIGMLLNQPILMEYYRVLESGESQFLFNAVTINKLVSRFPTTVKNRTYNPEDLKDNIKNYAAGKQFTDEQNAAQQAVLGEFLRLSKMAGGLTDVMLSTNYDTARYRSSDDYLKKALRTTVSDVTSIVVAEKGLISSDFRGAQAEKLNLSNEALSTLLVFEKPEVREVLNEVMRPYARDKYISNDDYQRIADKVRYSLLDYLVQRVRGINSAIAADIATLQTSVAARVAKAKKAYPDKNILQVLQVSGMDENNKPKNIKVAANIKDAYDENLYSGYFRELKEDPNTQELYYSLVRLAILQGTSNSPISFTNIIPFEDYAAIVAPVIGKIQSVPHDELMLFSKNVNFQRNAWRDAAVVPKIGLKRPYAGTPMAGQPFIYSGVPEVLRKAYPVADIIAISSKYNQKAVNYPVIKLQYENPTISSGKRMEMRRRGDYSFMIIKLYKRIEYPDGEPLTNADGTQVLYKQINAWGDSFRAAEHWEGPRPSVLDNGTKKVDRELTDEEIIRTYEGGQQGGTQGTPITPNVPVQPTTSKTPEFDTLPSKGTTPTMRYTGIGSRETPKGVLSQMAELAKELEVKGYTVLTGDADGADAAFRNNASKKEVFTAKSANPRSIKIAREVHPNPYALDRSKNPVYVWKLMARNTNQVFGGNLDSPVDFVLAWTPDGLEDGSNRTQLSGGTGQAIDMASRKGIPVINMYNEGWREKLDAILSNKPKTPTPAPTEITEVTRGTKKEKFNRRIIDDEGKEVLQEAEGYRVSIAGYPKFVGYLFKDGNEWTVIEGTTGRGMGAWEKTAKGSLAALPSVLNRAMSIPENAALLQSINLTITPEEGTETTC